MEGWIKLHRELMTKAIWQESTPEQKVILITLLMMANHQEKEWEWKGERYKARPGQFVTSLDSIVKKCGNGISTQNVRTAIKRFEKYDFLTNESTNKNRLITIVNWEYYQQQDVEPNKQTNKQLTSNQQATNKQLTTNKNVKNVKNERSNKNISLQISNLRSRYSDKQLKIIDEYFDILSWTRKNGKIADSVILKIYQEWEKHTVEKVIYALHVYINNPKFHDKKENYCYGIMRNATMEEIENYKSKRMAAIEQHKTEEAERKRIEEEMRKADEEAERERMRWMNNG